ncbi:MAG: superoxide dismutase family protein [Gemmatimonadota bacterium]|nr:superoxide dismutase family protein [Gemmatimonadota bacterium]
MSRSLPSMFAAMFLAVATACGPGEPASEEAAARDTVAEAAPEAAPDTLAVAFLDRDGAEVGDAVVEGTPNGVLIRVRLDGVPPGVHAFHVHETGLCEPPFTSSGGHLAAEGSAHGFRSPGGPHAGDLPNVYVPESGKLRFDAFAGGLSRGGGGGGLALLDEDGAALVLHAGADDYATDPAGAAGERIACAVVR